MNNNEIVRIMKIRCAIKEFDKSRIIADDDFSMLVEVARCSPSAFGLEPWRIIVLQNPEIRGAMKPFATGAQRQLDTCSHFAIFTVPTALDAESNYFRHICLDVKGLDESSYKEFITKFKAFQEERQDLTNSRKRTDWAGKQAYIAMSTMMYAAAFKGIDSCPIEGFVPNAVNGLLNKYGYN